MIITFPELQKRLEARLARAMASGAKNRYQSAYVDVPMVGRKTGVKVGVWNTFAIDGRVGCILSGTNVDEAKVKLDWTEALERELFGR